MKKVILAVVLIATIGVTNSYSQNDSTKMKDHSEHSTISMASFGVRGNCGMCKKTIEKAANSVEGVSNAVWDKEQKKIEVSFDSSKTNEMAIHEAIAASGYDTEKVNGSKAAYKNLPGCCKYDHEMEMNQTGESKSEHQH
jgi:copper chaperone CopZ